MTFEAITQLKNIPGVGRMALKAQKYSPQILTTVGVVGVVTAGVLAAKATLRLEEVVDKAKVGIDEANEKAHTKTAEEYSSTAHKQDITKVYFRTAGDLSKLYALPIALGVVSISCIVGGQGIQYKRTVASVAAYKTLEESFGKYRARVVEDLGLDKDEEYRRGFTTKETTDENGETTIEVDGNIHNVSGYVAFFDQTNPNWKNSPEYNLMFVKCQETYANQLLGSRGHVFLNDIYDSLGMKRTKQGAITGWVLNKEGDNFIDFRIQDLQSKSARVFGADDTDAILLDFNVDGIVWDLI